MVSVQNDFYCGEGGLMLAKFRDWIIGQVYLLQLQIGFLNTLLLILITITSNIVFIEKYIPWNPFIIILVLWPAGLIGMVIFSIFMDKFLNYARVYTSFANSRNPEIHKLLDASKRIEDKLSKIEARLKL